MTKEERFKKDMIDEFKQMCGIVEKDGLIIVNKQGMLKALQQGMVKALEQEPKVESEDKNG